MKISTYIKTKLSDVKDKTFVVTGSNSGIGFEITKILLEKGANVVLACRNEERAKNAIALINENKRAKCHFLKLDQSDLTPIDNFISELYTSFPYYDGIILNAGILKPKKESFTRQGFRIVVGTNFLGVMYLVEQIKKHDEIKKRKIIFQSSLMSRIGRYKVGQLSLSDSTKFHAYNISKMGVSLYFDDCSKTDVKNSYFLAEPGACYSNIYSGFPKILLPFADLFMKIFFHSAKKGALTAASLACNDYENGTILVPRGLFHFSGFPKKIKLSKKLKKSRSILRDGKNLIGEYL